MTIDKLAACLSAVALFVSPVQAARDDPSDKPIHPLVFQMVLCWWSDTESPVVTEVNLDAVRRNRNQFDRDAVTRKDGWIRGAAAPPSNSTTTVAGPRPLPR